MLSLFYLIIVMVFVLVAVSFYTLYERKILGGAHIRRGPNIVGYFGFLQPFSDAVKLFSKEIFSPFKSNFFLYFLCPVVIVTSSLIAWGCLPWPLLVFNFKYLILLFFILTAVGVYLHLGTGWSSNSNYGMIGALRCLAQSISYEISMAFILLTMIFLTNSIVLFDFQRSQSLVWFMMIIFPLMVVWWISSIAETNRSPFDFAEGESELVSGFNVEFGSGLFALLFIGEYTSMIFMSTLVVLLFSSTFNSPLFILFVMSFMYLYVWLRVSYPRTRYDKLMMLCWLIILPITLLLILASSIFI